ncbi:MAG: DUF58 domain-containing protein [Oscillospiraceae bacterium]|jgi:hypothetical protein|nr:DUF58 domain-containing protein [Oscillospiraceae bacterium]
MKGWFQGYLIIILVLIVVMRYINGETGLFLLSFFIALPILSFLITIFTRNNIELEVNTPQIVNKGRTFPVELNFKSKRNALACILLKSFDISELAHFDLAPVCFTYAGKNHTITLNEHFDFSGLNTIEVRFFIVDLLQIPFFKKEVIKRINIGVMYEISDEKITQPFNRINEDIQEEPDDTEVSMSNARSVTAGYDYRKYEVGDSLKKINWKLSARVGELMTRLDEAVNGVKIIFLIDFSQEKYERLSTLEKQSEYLKQRKADNEFLIETALILLKDAVEKGYSCTLKTDFEYEIFSVSDVENIAVNLAYSKFEDVEIIKKSKKNNKQKPQENYSTHRAFDFYSDKYTVFFLFSNNIDDMLTSQITELQRQGIGIQTFGTQDKNFKDYYNINEREK